MTKIGGEDYGGHGNGLYEKDAALKIAKEIKALSSQYGIDVVLTRDNDVFMSPKEKSDFANAQNADAFISVHVNTATGNESANVSGFEVYIQGKDSTLISKSRILGSSIIQSLEPNFSIAASLRQRQTGVWILKNSVIPAAIIECGYITNANDANNLKDDAKIELMAKNILQGVATYANNKSDKSSS